MNHTLTYYDILQVSPGACLEVIKAAYRALQKQMHPDKGGDTELAQAINEAGEVLSDPVERNRYDTRMRIGKAKTFSARTQVIEKIVERTFVFCLECGVKNRVDPDRMAAGCCGECKASFVKAPKSEYSRPRESAENRHTTSEGYAAPTHNQSTSSSWSCASCSQDNDRERDTCLRCGNPVEKFPLTYIIVAGTIAALVLLMVLAIPISMQVYR